jgi:hypothetical protein
MPMDSRGNTTFSAWAPNRPPSADAPTPSDATVYSYSPVLVWFMFAGSVFFAAMVIVVLALYTAQPTQRHLRALLVCVAVVAPLAVFSFRSFRRFRDSFAVNAEGVWHLRRNGSPTFLAWRDVATVRASDTAQRLVLSDVYGACVIRVEYQLDKFDQFRKFVLEHTSASSQGCGSSVPDVFHRVWIGKGICMLLLVGVGIALSLSVRRGDRDAILPGGIGALIFLGVVILDPSRVRIEPHAVIVEYPGWKRSIPYNAITGIELTTVQGRGNAWALVIIRRKKGRPLRLVGFREGSIVLREALDRAWRAAGGDRASGSHGSSGMWRHGS